MCPSYMATRDENATTRARANILREFLTRSQRQNPFNHPEIYQIMDLCLSCKACKSECPSNVDVAKLKAEFLQHYYDANGAPIRAKMIANIIQINKLGSIWPAFTNLMMNNPVTSKVVMPLLGFAQERSLPTLYKTTLDKWFKKNKPVKTNGRKVYLFNDEFTRFNDTNIGIHAILLLTKLGYEVVIPKHIESGRTYLSKGFLRKAKRIAIHNIKSLSPLISSENPLIGIEPSALLTFRDEYPELVDAEMRPAADHLAKHCFTIEEFLSHEFQKGKFSQDFFTKEKREILYHGHCQQKSIASTKEALNILNIPENYTATEIKSGCCGMAGSFGYEKEHYDVSMKVGELVLFPAVLNASSTTIVAASGTSCRHQIHDGTQKDALHPVEILYQALR